LRGNSFDPDAERDVGRRVPDDLEEEVAPRHEVQDLGDDRRAIVLNRHVGHGREIGLRHRGEEGQHAAEVLEAGRVDGQDLVRPVDERLGGGEGRLARRHVAPVPAAALPPEAPAIGEDPRPVRGRGHLGAAGDPGGA
jgi:hypothetical protein